MNRSNRIEQLKLTLKKLNEVSAAKNIFLFYNNEFQDEFRDIMKYLNCKSLFDVVHQKDKNNEHTNTIKGCLDVGLMPQ